MTRALADQAEDLARFEASATVPAGESPIGWRNLARTIAPGVDTPRRGRLVAARGARIGGRTTLAAAFAPAEEGQANG